MWNFFRNSRQDSPLGTTQRSFLCFLFFSWIWKVHFHKFYRNRKRNQQNWKQKGQSSQQVLWKFSPQKNEMKDPSKNWGIPKQIWRIRKKEWQNSYSGKKPSRRENCTKNKRNSKHMQEANKVWDFGILDMQMIGYFEGMLFKTKSWNGKICFPKRFQKTSNFQEVMKKQKEQIEK